MKRITAIALLLFPIAIFAQKQVTNLHYTYSEHFNNSKKTDALEKYHFNFNWNPETQILVEEKTRNTKDKPYNYPIHIIDQKRRTIVVEMEKRNEYVLEELDSFFYNNTELKPTGETKNIKGFNCKSYTTSEEIKFPFGIILRSDYTIWITEDLQFNEALNPGILALLKMQSGVGANFKGVIVEVDLKMSKSGKPYDYDIVTELDPTKFEQKSEPVIWPWATKDGVAWVNVAGNTSAYIIQPGWGAQTTDGRDLYAGSNMANLNVVLYRKNDTTPKIMDERLKALRVEITGQEKPKTKPQSFQNVFASGAWGQ